jgi:hypothetical protein
MDLVLPHPPGYELHVLSAEIENGDGLGCHEGSLFAECPIGQ